MACHTGAYLYRSGITMNEFKHENITLLNCDCMDYMATIPDKYFELAIVDPPYGLKIAKTMSSVCWVNVKKGFTKKELHKKKEWDSAIPEKDYFDELKRVSKNQIIWGGNYFTEFLPPTKAWIFWDKKENKTQGLNFSDGELAWTSLNKVTKYFKYGWIGLDYCNQSEKKQHPTQKPIALYEWLLTNYAKTGDKILDTHGGSFSSAIACNNLGFEFVGMELDKDYFDASVKRFEKHISQAKLFDFPVQEKQLNQAVIF